MFTTAHSRIILTFASLLLLLVPETIIIQSFKAESFADPAFSGVWERTDKAVAEGKAVRTWLWGPQPGAIKQESYAEAPGGQRLVQYFDKSRMEITNPAGDKNSRWYVTNGLLTKELVTGRVQLGDNGYETHSPSDVPVGGDPNNPGPTYASFARLVTLDGTNRAERKSGTVGETVDRAGKVGAASAELAKLARYTYYAPETGHNIPDVFWNWMQKLDEDWVFAMGLPISEPYWAQFVVGGNQRDLLVQLFERRVLTYNPANAPQWQVEMGNIGQHYYIWRYGSDTTAPASGGTPSTTPGSNGTPSGGSTTPTPAGTPAPGATPTPGSGTPTSLNQEEQKFLDLINYYRSQNNLPAFRLDEKLRQAARWLSEDMAKYNYFGHIDSQGRDYPKRFSDFGYNDTPVNELIAAGGQAQYAFDTWKGSPGYNAIMLNPELKAIGIGYATNDKATYQYYWTVTVGGK